MSLDFFVVVYEILSTLVYVSILFRFISSRRKLWYNNFTPNLVKINKKKIIQKTMPKNLEKLVKYVPKTFLPSCPSSKKKKPFFEIPERVWKIGPEQTGCDLVLAPELFQKSTLIKCRMEYRCRVSLGILISKSRQLVLLLSKYCIVLHDSTHIFFNVMNRSFCKFQRVNQR